MYCEAFGLSEKPFNMTPDPRFMYLSESHREALAHLIYGIDNRTGFIELTGEVGSGKTTVLRAFLAQLDPDRYKTALIFNPCLSALDLLRAVNREYGIPAEGLGHPALLETLNRFLIRQNEEGRTVVLVIDEAQNLRPEVLEQLRLISNLETDREKLLQIVLAGQPELDRLLGRNDLRQLNQRIVVRYRLRPMTAHDTYLYILHRLKVAGAKASLSFTKDAAKRLYRYSGGLPRLVNIAADRSLLAAYTQNTQTVTARVASAGIADVKPRRVSLYRKPLVAAGIAAVVFVAAGLYFYGRDLLEYVRPPAPVAATGLAAATVPAPPHAKGIEAVLKGQTEPESARAAFNAIAGLWKMKPVEGPVDLSDLQAMERTAREREFSLYRFSGNLGALLRLDSPAVLELRLPGTPEKRYVALTGARDEQILVDPQLAGKEAISTAGLESFWSGRALILWKNPLDIPVTISPGSSGRHVRELQGLLAKAGAYHGAATGQYDMQTIAAVRNFQSARGIEPDGVAGQQTLILLYRATDRIGTPGLIR